MAAKIYNTFNLDNVGFGEPRSNNNGGKFVPAPDLRCVPSEVHEEAMKAKLRWPPSFAG